MKSRSLQLIRHIMPGHDSHIICGNKIFLIRNTDGKSIPQLDIIGSFMPYPDVDLDSVRIHDSTVSHIHGVCCPVLTVSCHDEHRLGIYIRVCSKVFSHFSFLLTCRGSKIVCFTVR